MKTKISRRDAEEIIRRTFPEWKGRKVYVELATTVTLHDLHWGGGSRTVYAFVNVDGRAAALDFSTTDPWSHQTEGKTVTLPPTVCCVAHATFCGKDAGITITVNPNDQDALPAPIRALLPAPRV